MGVTRRLRARVHLSIRTRLALALSAGLFSMGLVVIGVSYWMVDRSLSPDGTRPVVVQWGAQTVWYGAVPRSRMPDLPAPDARGVAIRKPVSPAERARIATTTANLERFSADLRAATLRGLVVTWAEIVGVMALASGLLGWLLASRMLRPLLGITGTARRLSAANLHERIALTGPRDELRDLADTFDAMLGRLDAAFASQRRFVANASHELRTPLAIMRAQIDVAVSDPEVSRTELLATVQVVRDAVDRCERLLDGLLMLARSDRGVSTAEPLDLAEVAGRALEQVAPDAAEQRLEVRTDMRPAPVLGDRALLDRVVSNLLENALAYNHLRGWVDVRTEDRGNCSAVRVLNSGPEVAPDQVERLFEPFRRLMRDRTSSGRGAGLGLSIVRSVARAHGGEAWARALPAGGLAVEVQLPGAEQRLPDAPVTARASAAVG